MPIGHALNGICVSSLTFRHHLKVDVIDIKEVSRTREIVPFSMFLNFIPTPSARLAHLLSKTLQGVLT